MKTLLFSFLFISAFSYGQKAMSFSEAKEKGIFPKVDSIYKSAVHDDSSKAVFKTDEEIEKHIEAYQKFLQEFGAFLFENNFKWVEQTRCFNRIYMSPDGTIDYFLYQFKGLDPEKEKEFNRLLALYIKDHKFGVISPVRFAQCSPVTYPKSE